MDKLKKIVFEVINLKTEGVDTYHNSGSMWLIFTDKKKWVIELTKQGTLWYNYIFFQDCFKYLSLDVMKNQRYITEWVEGILQNGVEETTPSGYLGSIEMKGKIVHQFESPKQNNEVEDTVQNGVKETNPHYLMGDLTIGEVIQNGVKETKMIEHDRTTYHGYFNQERGSHTPLDKVQDVIENGIKETYADAYHYIPTVEGVITNKVKETNWRRVENFPEFEERVIEGSKKMGL